MTVTSVVRPLPGPGLVARSGDLMLVCAEGTEATRAEVEQLLGLVPEVANMGGDGAVLVRRVAALLAADLDGLFPDCAACGPIADGRLAVLVWGTATARVVGGAGEVTLSATDAVTSVNRLVPGPITSIRLELPGAGPASRFARLEAGVVSAAGFVAGEEAPGGAAAVFPAPVPTGPAQAAEPAIPTVPSEPAIATASAEPAEPAVATEPPVAEPSPAPAWSAPAPEPPAVPEPTAAPEPTPAPDSAPTPEPAPAWTPPTETPAWASPAPAEAPSWASESPAAPQSTVTPPETAEPAPAWAATSVGDAPAVPAQATPVAEPSWSTPSPAESPALPVREPLAEPAGSDPRPTVLGLACPLGHLNDPSLAICAVCGSPLPTQPPTLREGPRPPLGVLTLDDGSQHLLDIGYVLGREPQHDPEVVAGGARALKIVDAEGVVSRRHLRVALVGWDIQIIDLGSANGTFVQHPDDPQLHKLEPHHAVVVKIGTQVTMGRRSFRIDPVPADQRG